MVKSMEREDFIKYISGLHFYDMKDLLHFVRVYYDEYYNMPFHPKDAFYKAFDQYSIVMSLLGPKILSFAELVIKEGEKLYEQQQQLQQVQPKP